MYWQNVHRCKEEPFSSNLIKTFLWEFICASYFQQRWRYLYSSYLCSNLDRPCWTGFMPCSDKSEGVLLWWKWPAMWYWEWGEITPIKGNKPAPEKVECFGIKDTDTEESAWIWVVKDKQNGEQVRTPRNDGKTKQLHSSKQVCNKEGWCPQQECCGSGAEPTEEKTGERAMQNPPTQISLLVYSVEQQHTARGISAPCDWAILLHRLSLTAWLRCQSAHSTSNVQLSIRESEREIILEKTLEWKNPRKWS